MARHPLPPCSLRGDLVPPGRVQCHSPYRFVPLGHLSEDACTTCWVRNKSLPPPPLDPEQDAGVYRHLIYHCYPVGQEWIANLAALRERISLFNGCRMIAVALGPNTASLDEVQNMIPGADVEWIPISNDSRLWEMASYPALLKAMSEYRGPKHVHWYGHAKGARSIERTLAVREWREAMYRGQLDYWPLVRRELQQFAAVGCFARPHHVLPGSQCKWHFSGNFRWCRHSPLFERNWQDMDSHFLGSETHLGIVLDRTEVHSLFGDNGHAGTDLYQLATWEGCFRGEAERWFADHAAESESPMLVTVILPSARQPELVHDAIRSVQLQTTDAWQLLIADAGRLEAEGAFDRYRDDPRIHVLVTGEQQARKPKPGGQGKAINRAFNSGRVRGDLVCCLSDDDVFDPHWLATLISRARSRPEEQAWHGWAHRTVLEESGEETYLDVLRADQVAGPGQSLRCRIDGIQFAVRRQAWQPWPEAARLARESDGYWMDAICERTPGIPLDACVGRHRHSPLSTFTSSADVRRQL